MLEINEAYSPWSDNARALPFNAAGLEKVKMLRGKRENRPYRCQGIGSAPGRALAFSFIRIKLVQWKNLHIAKWRIYPPIAQSAWDPLQKHSVFVAVVHSAGNGLQNNESIHGDCLSRFFDDLSDFQSQGVFSSAMNLRTVDYWKRNFFKAMRKNAIKLSTWHFESESIVGDKSIVTLRKKRHSQYNNSLFRNGSAKIQQQVEFWEGENKDSSQHVQNAKRKTNISYINLFTCRSQDYYYH